MADRRRIGELPVWRLALLRDEKTLVSGSKDGVVNLWDTSRKHFRSEHIALPGKPAGWQFSKDSASVITVDEVGEVARWSGRDLSVKEQLMSVNGGDPAAFRRDAFTVLLSDHRGGPMVDSVCSRRSG